MFMVSEFCIHGHTARHKSIYTASFIHYMLTLDFKHDLESLLLISNSNLNLILAYRMLEFFEWRFNSFSYSDNSVLVSSVDCFCSVQITLTETLLNLFLQASQLNGSYLYCIKMQTVFQLWFKPCFAHRQCDRKQFLHFFYKVFIPKKNWMPFIYYVWSTSVS